VQNNVQVAIRKVLQENKKQYLYMLRELMTVNDGSEASTISKSIKEFREALAKADIERNLPLHRFLLNKSSPTHDTLLMIEKYPAALQHRNDFSQLPLHLECLYQCRSAIISKCIELYPDASAKADKQGQVLLQLLLHNRSSTIADALMMIEKYPAALQHRNSYGQLPLHIECDDQCRAAVVSKCIELYPESLDNQAINSVMLMLDITINFHSYASVLSIIFAARPMSFVRSSFIC
jgi:hypothetical protein